MPTLLSQPYSLPVSVQSVHYDPDFPLMWGGKGAWQVYTYASVHKVISDFRLFSNAYMPRGPIT